MDEGHSLKQCQCNKLLQGSVDAKSVRCDACHIGGDYETSPLQLVFTSLGHQSGTEASSVTLVSSEDFSINTSLA